MDNSIVERLREEKHKKNDKFNKIYDFLISQFEQDVNVLTNLQAEMEKNNEEISHYMQKINDLKAENSIIIKHALKYNSEREDN